MTATTARSDAAKAAWDAKRAAAAPFLTAVREAADNAETLRRSLDWMCRRMNEQWTPERRAAAEQDIATVRTAMYAARETLDAARSAARAAKVRWEWIEGAETGGRLDAGTIPAGPPTTVRLYRVEIPSVIDSDVAA